MEQNTSEKKVSIVLPVYNGEQFLSLSIESVLSQTYQNWELIIVNDCSTDNSPAIMEKYVEKDPRIRIIHNAENQKLPESLNIGFRAARGDYFTWTSDDNMYKPDAIETMVSVLDTHPECGLVYCDMDYIDNQGKITSGTSFEVWELYYEDCVGACFLYRREVAELTGEYDAGMILVEDYDYWLRMSKHCEFFRVPERKYQYRFHPDSLTMTRAERIQQQVFRLRMRELDYLLEKTDGEGRERLFFTIWANSKETARQLEDRFFPDGRLPEKLMWMENADKGAENMDKDRKIILFGAGVYGKKALEYFGRDRIAYFADNNADITGTEVEGVEVISFGRLREIYRDYQIVISVSARTTPILAKQLEEAGISDYVLYVELAHRLSSGSKKESTDYIGLFKNACKWIEEHSVPGEGIINSTVTPASYPEVTGYYIPSLLQWGYRDLALKYAKWLCSIQKPDGSWYDTGDEHPYVFDTAQILKGLLAIRGIYPEADGHIRRGCDWMLENIGPDGHLTTPDQSQWNAGECTDLIHLYCLEPLYTAAKIYGEPKYRESADRVKAYYFENRMDEIMGFGMLSHFYAYVMEALCDIGETDTARRAMERIGQLQRQDGMVPAYRDVNWVCSTGLFQLAIVWYKLGDLERGNRAFRYACSLQNPSGGWFGSYATKEKASVLDEKEYPTYFPEGEISWAVKYFLDALSWKCRVEFEIQAPNFFDGIDKNDGRYQAVLSEILDMEGCRSVCDIGCGKGNYLKNLLEDTAGRGIKFSCADISERVMDSVPPEVEKRQGTLTNIPYPDESFDVIYTAEALEHAICLENAVKELLRVTKPGGKVVVVDKNKDTKVVMEIEEWEQWFDDAFFERMAEELGCGLEVHRNLVYDGGVRDELFNCWVMIKK